MEVLGSARLLLFREDAMRTMSVILWALLLACPLLADPSPDQWAVVKKYDGKQFTAQGLTKVKTQSNGWTQYEWTEGRSFWVNPTKGWWAVVEADGTEVYRYAASRYQYNFPDGRVITSDPVAGQHSWNPCVGDPAPDFELASIDGKSTVKLSALKGKVVFLDFWASWCGPCQRALPGTEALYQKFKARGLVVLGINIEGNKAKAKANAAQLGLTFPNLAAEGTRGKYDWDAVQIRDYQVTGIPHGVLIDKKGVIRAQDTAFDDEALVKALLAE